MARERGSTGYSTDVQEAGKMAASPPQVQATASTMKTAKSVKGKQGQGRWTTETATQARRERRNRWCRVIGPGPPLHPEGDDSQCTGVVLSKTTRER